MGDGRNVYALGLCATHYSRQRRTGSPGSPSPARGSYGAGSANPFWKGVEIGYDAAHQRVRAARGSASSHWCSCGVVANQWAYDHADSEERTEMRQSREVRYSVEPSHYVAMCYACHQKFDRAAL